MDRVLEEFPARPLLYRDSELDSYIGTIHVDTGAIADLSASYGLTLGQIGVNTIHFSPYTTGYDTETATLQLGVLTDDAPPNVVNPSGQHRNTMAHRSVPASSGPEEYFAGRSEELSRTLQGMLTHLAIDAGYQPQDIQDLRGRRSLERGAVHTVAGAAALFGVYKANELGFLDTPIGLGMTAGALAFVVGMDVFASSESHRQQDEAMRALVARHVLEAYDTAPASLICIIPPGLR